MRLLVSGAGSLGQSRAREYPFLARARCRKCGPEPGSEAKMPDRTGVAVRLLSSTPALDLADRVGASYARDIRPTASAPCRDVRASGGGGAPRGLRTPSHLVARAGRSRRSRAHPRGDADVARTDHRLRLLDGDQPL